MNPSTRGSSEGVTVVGLCGSLRSGSCSRSALNIALDGAREVGAGTRLIDLREYDLVFCDGGEDESRYPQDVFKLRKEVRLAEGLILATPEYHGSYSGLLKNALDLMGFSEIEGKMIGLVGVSGGKLGAVNALNGLRMVGRALHAWVIPEQASIPEAWKLFDDSGELLEEELRERVKEVGRQVARFSYLHSADRAQEFLQAWEGAPINPGGGTDAA